MQFKRTQWRDIVEQWEELKMMVNDPIVLNGGTDRVKWKLSGKQRFYVR